MSRAFVLAAAAAMLGAGQSDIPSTPLTYGFFTAHFAGDATFSLEGQGWPTFKGSWRRDGTTLVFDTAGGGRDCTEPGRYKVAISGDRVSLDALADTCTPRRMILDRSNWRPVGTSEPIPERRILRTAANPLPAIGNARAAAGSWPSFRGPSASGIADRQNLPDTWNAASGKNILWRTAIPGLSHSSPIVWGDRIFVTTAISADPNATFRPGIYGDGDASEDRSRHRWMIYALDKRSGTIVWERVAYEGEPLNKRHIKSTYASSTPATDGRIVVAWFGSQGVHAYDLDGRFLWKVDIGRVNMGAYDIPSYEWGPASSPIIWNGLVIIQCDTQADSFVLALNAATGDVVWKTARAEQPSWGTPTVAVTSGGPELITNASKLIRGYDPRTGKELWRLGPTSNITAPTPIFADDLFVFASGRAPERPIFVVRAGARGDVTPPAGLSSNKSVAWSRQARGPYMPTPIIYGGVLHVLANNGVLDAYDLRSGDEIYRERLPHVGNGYSASPVAADGKLYLSSEDGEMLVVSAGRTFRHIATNSMDDLLMATPALSDGVLYVRTARSLFAITKTGK